MVKQGHSLPARPLHILCWCGDINTAPCSCIASDTYADCQRGLLRVLGWMQALEGMQSGPLEQVPIQDYFPAASELSPVEFAEA